MDWRRKHSFYLASCWRQCLAGPDSTRVFHSHVVASNNNGGHDNIVRTDASFTVRVYRQHGIALKYLLTQRDSSSPALGTRSQSPGTVGIFYTLLGHDRLGAIGNDDDLMIISQDTFRSP